MITIYLKSTPVGILWQQSNWVSSRCTLVLNPHKFQQLMLAASISEEHGWTELNYIEGELMYEPNTKTK